MAGGRLVLVGGGGDAPQAKSGKTGWQIMNEKSPIKGLRFLLMMSNNVTGRACCCVRAYVRKGVSKKEI